MLLVYTFAEAIHHETSDIDSMTFSFSFPNPCIQISTIFEKSYQLSIAGLENSNEYLHSRLPIKSLTILLPYNKALQNIDIICPETLTIGNINAIDYGGAVIPLSEHSMIDTSVPFKLAYDPSSPTIAQQNERYSLVGTYLFRGYTLLNINIYPILFSHNLQQIYFCPTMNVVITLKNSETNAIQRDNMHDANCILSYVENPEMVSTYSSSGFHHSSIDEHYEYVIITSDSLKNADGEYTFQDLVAWKQYKGINATIVTVQDIKTNLDFSVNGKWGDNNPDNPFYQSPLLGDIALYDDTEARIRNFIRFAYAEWGTEYVLLAGDADANHPKDNIIPVRGLFADENGLPLITPLSYEMDDIPSDIYYACLDGNFNYDGDFHFGEAPAFNVVDGTVDEADLYAEVSVGRACVDSVEEVSNFVKKTLTYDQLFYDEYFSKVLFLGEYLGSQFFYQWGGDYKDEIEYLFPQEYNITKLYERDGTKDSEYYWYLLNENPPLIINHDGHGSPNSAMGLNCRGIEELANDRYFFIYSHTCLAGAFDNCWPPDNYYELDCVAEYFTVETDHGAIGVIMNSRYGLGSQYSAESPSGAYDESFFAAIFNNSIRQIGPANHYAKQDHIWQINENGMRWAYYETNLLGDPELSLKKPLPDIDVKVTLTNPIDGGCLYVNDGPPHLLSFLQKPFVVGGITLKADASSIPDGMVESVSFVVDDEVVYVDALAPYSWFWIPEHRGMHTISAVATALYDFSAADNRAIYTLWC